MAESKKPKNQAKFLVKAAILGVINIICVLFLIWLLTALPKKADKLKNLRTLKHKAALVNLGTIESEIMVNKTKTNKLKMLFPDEVGLINFVKEIDKLKSEGRVTHFSFVSDKVIKDKTQAFGLPFIIELHGGWAEIDLTLREIEKLPFLIRAVDIEIRELPQEAIRLKYGGVLYVDESFYKD